MTERIIYCNVTVGDRVWSFVGPETMVGSWLVWLLNLEYRMAATYGIRVSRWSDVTETAAF